MFEKLLANLPYNPDLTKQIGFYARRMRREESIRRTGLVFIVLAFMVQFFAFMSPPQSASADYSNSDMVNGGISSKADAVAACRQNLKNYGDALWNFKIDCDDVANTSVTTVRSTDRDNSLFSFSWLPYGQTNPHSGKPTDETPYNLAKISETIYARRLVSADTIPFSTYQVLQGKTSDGRTFFIMFGCGNLMFYGTPPPADICRNNGEIYYAGDARCKDAHFEQQCPTNPAVSVDSPKCKPPCQYDRSIPADSGKCPKPCPYDNGIPKDSPKCKPCKKASSNDSALACIIESKSASNTTQNLADANGSTAQPNDVIVYTLFAENQGKETVKNFVMQENLSDVLDYATVVSLHGGKINANKMVTWPSTTIQPGGRLSHKITVRVKNPVPTNAPSVGDPSHFDHIMTNVYGNAVNIKLPSPNPVVITPALTTAGEELPNTGPGTSLAIIAIIVMLAGYFFARSRLLVDESMIAIQESNSGKLGL